jgi:hypothetical protein
VAAFARKVEQTNPGEAEFQLILNEALSQESKNAWRIEDVPAIEGALRHAFTETQMALYLGPHRVEVRSRVVSCDENLVHLITDRSAPP